MRRKKGNNTLKMESTDNTALNDQLRELQEKISNFANSIEQTSISLDNMQKEIKSLKNPNESYASVLGANNAGKVVYKPQTFNHKTLGIRIRGFNESKSKEDGDRMQEDLCHVEQILKHLHIEDRKITKLVRLGKYNSENKRERVILVLTASEISRDLILKSVSRLKDYKYNDKSIYISPELSPKDAKKKENKALLKRRELITSGIDSKLLRIRHLELEMEEGGNWVMIPYVNKESQTSENDYVEALKYSPSMLEAC